MPSLHHGRAVAGWAGPASSLGLAASGLAIAVRPQEALAAIGLAARSARGAAETRAGLGGTFAALGLWAAARGTADAYRAVGVTWLGAAVARSASLRLDEPETPVTFWAFLLAELALGVAGLAATPRRN